MLRKFMLKIRRRETPFYDFLYRFAKGLQTFRIPAFRPIYGPLYYLRGFCLHLWGTFWRAVYYDPLFRVRCHKVGERLMLIGGIPLIEGNLKITVGDDCQIYGKTTFTCTRVYDEPELIIGDRTHFGFQGVISVGQRVELGNDVRIAQRCFIADNDGHPQDYWKRRKMQHQPVAREDIKPIKIEDDCWISSNTLILKGVTIGQASIIGGNSVVTRSIPPFCVAAGAPAKVIKELPIPDELAHLRERRDREMGRTPKEEENAFITRDGMTPSQGRRGTT